MTADERLQDRIRREDWMRADFRELAAWAAEQLPPHAQDVPVVGAPVVGAPVVGTPLGRTRRGRSSVGVPAVGGPASAVRRVLAGRRLGPVLAAAVVTGVVAGVAVAGPWGGAPESAPAPARTPAASPTSTAPVEPTPAPSASASVTQPRPSSAPATRTGGSRNSGGTGVAAPVPPEHVVDLARAPGAAATQSSVADGSAPPSVIIDGARGGTAATAATTVAETAPDSWMLVDLGAVRRVTGIRLWGRTDCCTERAEGVRVMLSASPFLSDDPARAARQPGVTAVTVVGRPDVVSITVDGRFRYVRLQSRPGERLTVSEVEVLGEAPVEWRNLARAKGVVPRLSTVVPPADPVAEAAALVDGRRDGDVASGDVVRTSLEAAPYADLDLGTVRRVGMVRLWNRTDCCTDRLEKAKVFLSATPFTSADPNLLVNDPTVTTLVVRSPRQVESLLTAGRFRYVRVQVVAPATELNLAEIEVFPART